MNNTQDLHSFHIPVMGIGFTIDTPIRIAKYGITSTVSLVDDILMEKLRKYYSNKFNLEHKEITKQEEDYRAKRITAYLNLINLLSENSFAELKKSNFKEGSELKKYVDWLPDNSLIKAKFKKFISEGKENEGIEWLRENIKMGEIEANIMTKLDKSNYKNGDKLPNEFNDAHAALRGFAQSDLSSSIVLSAGMHPRLYSYMENFKDFYPNEDGKLKKKIVLKVSDFRSAAVQGKFFAKKGLWVSEYRIESALNCGGHAFATQGFLLGPILEEFKENWDDLLNSTYQIYCKALQSKGNSIPASIPEVKLTAQGGVGTNEEHNFLLSEYKLNSIGWGSPFLLVKEVTNVDENTRNLLANAKEEDLYLSNTSPLGVPFNTLRSNTKDAEKELLITQGKPGSVCTKGYGEFNYEFTEKGVCTGSRQYQAIKVAELKKQNLDEETFKKEYNKVVEKSCICVGLGTSTLLINNIEPAVGEGNGVSVCPGPNLAYFSEQPSLERMIGHIYNRETLDVRKDRPNVFIKEIQIYLEYLKNELKESNLPLSEKQLMYFNTFKDNLKKGIEYYNDLFNRTENYFKSIKDDLMSNLKNLEVQLIKIKL